MWMRRTTDRPRSRQIGLDTVKRNQDHDIASSAAEKTPAGPATGNLTPTQLVGLTALAIFVAELLIMFFLPLLPPIPVAFGAFLDALLLTLIAAPVLYFFLFRPLVLQIDERIKAERALRELNQSLEERVELRTADLARSNKALQIEIHERKATEDRIRRANNFVQRLIESAPCLMATIDVTTMKSNYVNGRIEDFLGISPDEVAAAGGKILDLVVAESSRNEIERIVRELAVAPHGEIARKQLEFKDSDGRITPFRCAIVVASRTAIEEAEEVLLVATPVDDCA
jgi:PAS domain-containing protein